MSFADAVEAVNREALDGMANAPFDSAVNNGVPKVVAYASDAGRLGINSVSISSLNQNSFDKLTPRTTEGVDGRRCRSAGPIC